MSERIIRPASDTPAGLVPVGRVGWVNEGDLWRWQLEALADLAAFVRKHGPGRPGALPAVPWHVGTGRRVTADLSGILTEPHSGRPRDIPAVLAAYAEHLGVEVERHDVGRADTLTVRGRIGAVETSAKLPRTQMLLSARIYREQDGGEL